MKTAEVLKTLALLTPWDISGRSKLRIGNAGDGGYVALDMLRPEQPVYSYGVGPDSSFDFSLGQRGHQVFMYDHTVEGPRGAKPSNCHFIREGIAPVPTPGQPLDTLENHLARNGHLGRRDLILKMDIEGAEWPVFGALPGGVFTGFEQIMVEVHGLRRLGNGPHRRAVHAALSRLAARFTLFHVHANVWGGLALVEGLPVANVLELSYVRSDLVERVPSRTLYPTSFDRSNRGGHKDVVLGFFPFLPPSATPEALAQLAARLDEEQAAWAAECAARDAAAAQAAQAQAPPAP